MFSIKYIYVVQNQYSFHLFHLENNSKFINEKNKFLVRASVWGLGDVPEGVLDVHLGVVDQALEIFGDVGTRTEPVRCVGRQHVCCLTPTMGGTNLILVLIFVLLRFFFFFFSGSIPVVPRHHFSYFLFSFSMAFLWERNSNKFNIFQIIMLSLGLVGGKMKI